MVRILYPYRFMAVAEPAQGVNHFMLSNPPYGKSWKTDLERMGGKKDMRFSLSKSLVCSAHRGVAAPRMPRAFALAIIGLMFWGRFRT